MNSCAKKHYELLVNLLDWSKAQFNQSSIIKDSCNLYEIIEKTVLYHRESLESKELKVFNKVPKELTIQSNESMLATVFRNLLSNAIKFSNPEGKIIFDINYKNNEYTIKVEDQGIGMSQGTLKNLFNINYIRSLRGTKKEIGTGLGLILCREIIHQLNGKIIVLSEENIGSKFLISLPEK
jgi:signal transduction histidine kinase